MEKHGCLYLDATGVEISLIDCEHLTERGHEKLAELLVDLVRRDMEHRK